MTEFSKKYWINKLELQPHPEGGFYKEVFRSTQKIEAQGLTKDALTSIHFLISENDFSHFHILQSDEIWYHHQGANAIIHCIDKNGTYTKHTLGKEHNLQVIIPRNTHFAAEYSSNQQDDYTLVGCAVAPGFEFSDFKMSSKSELLSLCSSEEGLISRLSMKEE